MFKNTTRRSMVLNAAAAGASLALPASALAQASSAAKTPLVGPLAPNPAEFKKLMEQFTGGKATQADGLQLDVPVLADNPSAVPVKVKVTLPITEQDWCEEIIVLAELNPSPLSCRMQFTALTGTAEAAVRVRLNAVGGQRMFDYSSQHVGKPMAVVYTERVPTVTVVDGQEVRGFKVNEEVISVANINGVFGKRMEDVAGRLGARVDALEFEWGTPVVPDIVEKQLKKGPYKLVAVVHAETSTGVANPVHELSRLVKGTDALYLVDCVTDRKSVV